jgi:hypothetical protein
MRNFSCSMTIQNLLRMFATVEIIILRQGNRIQIPSTTWIIEIWISLRILKLLCVGFAQNTSHSIYCVNLEFLAAAAISRNIKRAVSCTPPSTDHIAQRRFPSFSTDFQTHVLRNTDATEELCNTDNDESVVSNAFCSLSTSSSSASLYSSSLSPPHSLHSNYSTSDAFRESISSHNEYMPPKTTKPVTKTAANTKTATVTKTAAKTKAAKKAASAVPKPTTVDKAQSQISGSGTGIKGTEKRSNDEVIIKRTLQVSLEVVALA